MSDKQLQVLEFPEWQSVVRYDNATRVACASFAGFYDGPYMDNTVLEFLRHKLSDADFKLTSYIQDLRYITSASRRNSDRARAGIWEGQFTPLLEDLLTREKGSPLKMVYIRNRNPEIFNILTSRANRRAMDSKLRILIKPFVVDTSVEALEVLGHQIGRAHV